MAGRPKRRERAGLDPHPARTEAEARTGTPVHDAAERRARGYRWETFEKANYLSVRHGAYSDRIIDPLAAELVERLLEEAPDLDRPRYRYSLAAWARAETRVQLLQLFLDAAGIVHTEGEHRGEPRDRILRELRAEENRAAQERERLGLSPTGHAALARERAEAGKRVIDLDAVRARGREALAAGLPGARPRRPGWCGVSALGDAEVFLTEFLADGPRPAREVAEAGEAAGVSARTLRRAADALGVVKRRHGRPGEPGGWTWRLAALDAEPGHHRGEHVGTSAAEDGQDRDGPVDAFEVPAGLVLPDGRTWGEAAAPVQLEDARAVLAPEPEARRHWIGRCRGFSKTSDAGAMTIAAVLGGIVARGERGFAVAADKDQAALLAQAIDGWAARSPGVRGLVTVETSKVVFPHHDALVEAAHAAVDALVAAVDAASSARVRADRDAIAEAERRIRVEEARAAARDDDPRAGHLARWRRRSASTRAGLKRERDQYERAAAKAGISRRRS